MYIKYENKYIKIGSTKDIKNRLFVGKLKTVSEKYIDVLANADDHKIAKTSLKDVAIIAGVLIDKQLQIEHKQSDVVKNQSIIFNLFSFFSFDIKLENFSIKFWFFK